MGLYESRKPSLVEKIMILIWFGIVMFKEWFRNLIGQK